jgi:hypothetical protein
VITALSIVVPPDNGCRRICGLEARSSALFSLHANAPIAQSFDLPVSGAVFVRAEFATGRAIL